MSPFDNQITVIHLSGAELRQVLAIQAHHGRFRVGFSGMHVTVTCEKTGRSVAMRLADGREIADEDSVSIAVADYLALGGDDVFTTVMPEGGYERQLDAPLARDALIDWLQEQGGSISASDFSSEHDPKWTVPDEFGPDCLLQ